MRLLSYNILDGGTGRADPLAEIIESNRPDVVTLIEADEQAVVERIARRMKMDFIHAGTEHAVAILSRYPIADSINHAPLNPELSRSFLQATLTLPSGTPLVVAAIHLHAHAGVADEKQRLAEVRIILDRMAPLREAKRPHLLCGDFNANSPQQRINPDKCKPATRKSYSENGGFIPREVIAEIISCGYLDTLQQRHGEQAGEMTTFSTEHPGQRVDYIFSHGIDPQQVVDAWIERERLATYTSDHYPVGAELRL